MKRLALYLASAGSGLLTCLALPLVLPFVSIRQLDVQGHLEFLAWVSLVPAFLALSLAKSTGKAALLGLVAGFSYFFASIHWVSHAMTAFGGLSSGLALLGLTLLVLYMAMHWAGAFAASFFIEKRLGWPLFSHLPFVWAAFEILRNYLFSGFPWADVGYTQARTTLVAQLASVGGVYLLAALVVLVNSVIAQVISSRLKGQPFPALGALAAVSALAATLIYGAVHLATVRAEILAAPTFSVGIVQPNVDQSRKNDEREQVRYILPRLVEPSLEADQAGADLVVWPEASFPTFVPEGQRNFAESRFGMPRLTHAYLLAGVVTMKHVQDDDGRWRYRVANESLLLNPDLRVVGMYRKNHLVPFGEYVPLAKYLPFIRQVVPNLAPTTPGDALEVLSFPTSAGLARPASSDGSNDLVRLAPMICFDAIFPEINIEFSRQKPPPDVLVNTTDDAWYGYSSGPYQFLSIVQLRAVEAGKAVVRAAYAGVSALILPTGELAPGAIDVGPVDPSESGSDEPARLLMTKVPRLTGRTIYTRIGDAFGYGCAAFTLGALLASVFRRGRPAAPVGEA